VLKIKKLTFLLARGGKGVSFGSPIKKGHFYFLIEEVENTSPSVNRKVPKNQPPSLSVEQ
jgi:hypothetical protein